MKRTIYEIPRWTLYLGRKARGMPYADTYDKKDRRFEDEVFARLFEGDVTPLPEKEVNDPKNKDAAWDKGAHAQLENAVGGPDAFKAAAAQCKGNAALAAEATKKMLDSLPSRQTSKPASGKDRDIADGLGNVGFGDQAFDNKWKGDTEENKKAKTIAEKIKDNEQLKKIALLAGKFKRIVLSKQKTKVKHGADEISDVEQGDALERLLPSELVRFVSRKGGDGLSKVSGLSQRRRKLAAIRDLMERRCLQYQMTSVEELGRGPLILCIDKSGSMSGERDIWATAVALALLDKVHREHRSFVLLGFNEDITQRVAVKPGRPFPEHELLTPCGGGTNIFKVLDFALQAIKSRSNRTNVGTDGKIYGATMKRADIVVVTDGESDTSQAEYIKERAQNLDVRITGIGIGVGPQSMEPWCEESHCITNVKDMDETTADMLFGK